MLQALLDEGTWSAAEGGQTPSVGETEILPEGDAAVTAVEEPEAPESETPEPETPEPEAPEPESTNGHPPVVPVPSEPVLEMLAAREGVRGPDGSRGRRPPAAHSLSAHPGELRGRRARRRGRAHRVV